MKGAPQSDSALEFDSRWNSEFIFVSGAIVVDSVILVVVDVILVVAIVAVPAVVVKAALWFSVI